MVITVNIYYRCDISDAWYLATQNHFSFSVEGNVMVNFIVCHFKKFIDTKQFGSYHETIWFKRMPPNGDIPRLRLLRVVLQYGNCP